MNTKTESRHSLVAKIVAGGAAAVALLGVAACGDDAQPPQAASVWEQITSGIAEDGTVGLETALAAFSYAIGPVPGGRVPSGEREVLPDGTGAVAWTLAHYDELTSEQKSAVGAALSGDGSSAGAEAVPAGSLGRSARRAARTVGCYGQRLATADSPQAAPYRQIVDAMIDEIGGKLNRKLTMTTYVVVEKRAKDTSQAYTWVDPGADCKANKAETCEIHLNPIGAATTGAHLKGVLAHEVMHCYVFQILGVKAYDLPAWIGEGLPAWAGEAIAGGTASSQKWWRTYLTAPSTPLFRRAYDAIGIYAHAQANGVDIWHITSPMLSAFDSEPAWQALVGERDAILDSWPSGLLRDTARGSGWDATGPGITADKAQPGELGTVGNGASVTLTAGKVANALARVNLAADIADITVTGHARISLSDGANEVVHGRATWCLRASCSCPNGDSQAGRSVAAGPAVIAITGGLAAGSVRISGRKLACEQPKPAANVDQCVVGSWTSSDIRVHDTATGAGQELPGGSGVRLTVSPSGSVTLDQNGSTPLKSNVGGNIFATELAGSGSGQLTAIDGKLKLGTNDFNSTLTWRLVTRMGPGKAQHGTVALGTGTYSCSENSLKLTFPYPLGEVSAVYEK